MAEISPLRRRMIEDMTVRNLSPATQRSYIHAVSRFSRYFGHSPDRLGLEDVRAHHGLTIPDRDEGDLAAADAERAFLLLRPDAGWAGVLDQRPELRPGRWDERVRVSGPPARG